jgi:ribose transport system substrate-binding protein
MIRPLSLARLVAGVAAATFVLAACGGGSDEASGSQPSGSASGAANGNVPAWCGPKEITLGMTDGFGGNSWRLITTASGKEEAAKCPSVKEFLYADGQGNTQKAISDIQGMVAKGVDALVVFPDAGQAMLPALRSAFQAGVVTVPYRVFPGGEDGKDYTKYIALDSVNDGHNWANWIKEVVPNGGNVLFLSGPKGNSQGEGEAQGLHEVLDPTGKYTFIGEKPFEVTNWDPALTQQVLTAAIAKNSKIDVIASDFGPSLVGALSAFTKAGRSIPPIATSDGNVLGCFWQDNQAKNPNFKLYTIATGNDHVRTAMDYAIAEATGGQVPTDTVHKHAPFENSVTGQPNKVECRKDLPGDIYLSAQMPPEQQAKVIKK